MKENSKEELFTKVEILKPQPKDIITLYFNTDLPVFGLDNICLNVEYLSKKYPQNTIMALPNDRCRYAETVCKNNAGIN
jgi:hypothetical protein